MKQFSFSVKSLAGPISAGPTCPYAYGHARGKALVDHPSSGDGWLLRTRSEALELARRLIRRGFLPIELVLYRASNRGRTWAVEVTREGECRLADEAVIRVAPH